jgi:hypothetical protein
MSMSQSRGITTDHLYNVIQVLQMGRKTGKLIAERDNGPTQERGEILFEMGHITQAYCGHLEGQAALNWLNTWGTSRFTFVSYGSQRITGSHPSLQQLPASPSTPMNTNSSIFHHPTGNYAAAGQYGVGNQRPPQRNRPVEEALLLLDHHRLSRAHRRLLLLIDGQRTRIELTRLMGRSQDEVHALLQDLQRIHVIEL